LCGTGSFQIGIGQNGGKWPIHLWYYMGTEFPKNRARKK